VAPLPKFDPSHDSNMPHRIVAKESEVIRAVQRLRLNV
jgi:hypothetical protein